MEKPKRFIHKEVRIMNDYSRTRKTFYHVGRIEMTRDALTALVTAGITLVVLTQITLGFVSGWSNWVPALVVAGGVVVYLVSMVLYGIFSFFRWISGEITINGPGTRN